MTDHVNVPRETLERWLERLDGCWGASCVLDEIEELLAALRKLEENND